MRPHLSPPGKFRHARTRPPPPTPHPCTPPTPPLCPPGEFRHALTALKSILLNEGRRGLFAGYGSFLLRDLPFDALEFVSYEQMKKS